MAPALTTQLSVTAVKAIEFNLSVSAGINLIHLPLEVTVVDGMAKTIESIGDLYDALGGAGVVNFLITRDSQTQEWLSYFGASDTGTPADRPLSDDMGILAGMIHGKDILLRGDALGTNGQQHHHPEPRTQRCGAAAERFKNSTCERSTYA